VRHEAEIESPSREAVFETLRKRGVKAIKVMAADGSKANGEIRGIRKRTLFVCIACFSIATAIIAYTLARQTGESSFQLPLQLARPLPRQEINGDRARVLKAHEVFSDVGERYLSWFAEPGRELPQSLCSAPDDSIFERALDRRITYTDSEFTETIDLKRMVAGIKVEFRCYLNGGGMVSNYVANLVNRQKIEIAMRQKHIDALQKILSAPLQCSKEEVSNGRRRQLDSAYSYWITANAELRTMGIFAIPLPDSLLHYQPRSNVNPVSQTRGIEEESAE